MPEQASMPTSSSEPTPVLAPVSARERIETIDILRGFALFGVLLMNIHWFSAPGPLWLANEWTGTGDQAALWLTEFFARGQFIALFSFLFGLGFALQLGRAQARGARFFPLYRRRLLVLLLIGLVHGLLLWGGDILHWYAMFGFLLLLFRARSPRTILVVAFICLLTPHVRNAVVTGIRELRLADPQTAQEVMREDAERAAESRVGPERDLRVYSQGTYGEMVANEVRWFREWHSSLANNLQALGRVFVMFLLGLYAGRRRIFENIPAHLPLIRKVLWWGLGLGLAGNFVGYAYLYLIVSPLFPDPTVPSFTRVLAVLSLSIGRPALCFFYAAAIILLAQREAWKPRLGPLAAVGRLALTNYLLQSVVCVLIFYSYGLGLFGKVGPTLILVLSVFIFALQILLSVWWVRRFRFGPAEWLWRTLTYGKLQPMRVREAVALEA